ncbi:FtsX-like permease family protein [Actinoplanes sp. KI2]|uniref:ABC transporter permease n=1 Tax=Actinoplanes sp. KI2 TaxID=2983315 RepID=UPI0021D5C27F|nr:FtsX-like permease family protein [Actinoplanes sp. KI2]MCU7730034.1 FtsX-like permease family protein [Actinoplanes sp. KI2]
MLTRDRLGAFVAVLFGTAAVALTLTLLASAKPRMPDRYAAIAVAVRSPGMTTPADPFPESRPWSSAETATLTARLATIPGVTAAIPDRSFYAQPAFGSTPLAAAKEAHGWASAALALDSLVAGRPARADHEAVVSRKWKVAVGGTVTILTATGPSQWTVTGLIEAERLYVSDATAAHLAPGVRLIGLTGHPDPAEVRAVAAGATVLHGTALGDLEPRADARTRWIGLQVLSAMAALSAFACVFVIASTTALTVHQRRREIGLLRATGATPRQVGRSVMREAGTIGAVAGLAGTVLGLLLAPLVGRVLVAVGFEPASFAVGAHLGPIVAGLLAGPLIAVAGSLTAARRAARVGPLEALRQAEVETRPMSRSRWIVGLFFTAAGLVAGVATTVTDDLADLGTLALAAAMALVVGATALAPAAVPLFVRVLLRPSRGPVGMVMRESALAGARRTASTAAPVLLTMAFAVFIAGNVQTSADAYAGRRAEAARTGSVLVPDGTPGLTDAAAPTAPLQTMVYLNDTVVAAIGVDPAATSSPAAARALGAPHSVVVNASRASQLRVGLNDTLEVTFADGVQTPLRVAGVAPDNVLPAELVVGRHTVREHDPSALAAALPLPGGAPTVTEPQGTAPTRAAAATATPPAGRAAATGTPPAGRAAATGTPPAGRAAATGTPPAGRAAATGMPPAGTAAAMGARVVDVGTYARQADAEDDRLVWVFTMLLIGVSVGYGALAVANTLFMATARRAPDYRLLRLAGATPQQVLLAIAGESALVVAIGATLGAAAAVLALWGSTAGLRAQTGNAVTMTVPWQTGAITVSACLLLALAASVLPARARLARFEPIRELS